MVRILRGTLLEAGLHQRTVESVAEVLLTKDRGQAPPPGNTGEVNRIQALDDPEVIREDTGSYVFIRLAGYVLDAMEDFAIILEVSNGLLAA